MRDDRGGGVAKTPLNRHRDPMGGKDLDGGGQRRFGKGVGIHAHKQRPADLS